MWVRSDWRVQQSSWPGIRRRLDSAWHTVLPMHAEAITATLNFLEIGHLQPQAIPGGS
jgi:hypothetical protein